MFRNIMLFAVVFGLTGCVVAYKPSEVANKNYVAMSSDMKASLSEIKNQLVLDGFSLSVVGDGVISTLPKRSELSVEDADCGTTMGIDYLKDPRTLEYVAINVLAANGRVTIVTDINAEYLPNNAINGMKMRCMSRGTIESKLLSLVK